jgi:hypothetical protein
MMDFDETSPPVCFRISVHNGWSSILFVGSGGPISVVTDFCE